MSLALLLRRQYEFPFGINIVQFSMFNFSMSMFSDPPYRQPTPPRLAEIPRSPPPPLDPSPTPRMSYDERPLPAMKK